MKLRSGIVKSQRRKIDWFKVFLREEGGKSFVRIFPKGARSQNQYSCPILEVQLQTQDEAEASGAGECPITLERFGSSDVDFLPRARMVPRSPELCAARLPCGHVFGAVPVFYNMLVSGIKCPMCRAGPGCSMQVGCVPPHIRSSMWSKASGILRREMADRDAINRQTAMAMIGEMLGSASSGSAAAAVPGSAVVHENIQVFMTVYFYSSGALLHSANGGLAPAEVPPASERRSIFTAEYPLSTSDNYTFSMSPGNVRSLSSFVDTLGSTAMRITVHSTAPGGQPIQLSTSGMFSTSDVSSSALRPAPSTNTLFRLVGGGGDFFNMRREGNSASGGGLTSVEWSGSQHILTRMFA